MKSIKRAFIALLMLAAISSSAFAQFKWGIKAGMNVTSMHLDKSTFESANRAGFTGGLTCEFTVPLIGIGADLSLMYTHRTNVINDKQSAKAAPSLSSMLPSFKSDFIEIPLHLKYKIGLPVVGNIISPYIFTGPCFGILASKKAINDAWSRKAFDFAWDFGLGIQLVNHLQIGAGYGLGINKIAKFTGAETAPIEVKNNCWTITAAYLF